jgi:hypothetical protein
MDARYEKFITSKQEPLRLKIALEGFFQPETADDTRAAYGAYLRRRLRPAAEALIDGDDTLRLAQLAGWLTAQDTDALISLAREKKKTAALVWLLRWKGERYGFSDRDFSL